MQTSAVRPSCIDVLAAVAAVGHDAKTLDDLISQATLIMREALDSPGLVIRVSDPPGHAVTVEGAPDGEHDKTATAAALLLDALVARLDASSALEDLRGRMANAQQLANMGDYDWHIASDTNTWSDQLYRIYGHEPQAFNASYDRFLAQIHPDDRERVKAVHQEAYATGNDYQMLERIVRPDGEVRYLVSNGQVVMDEAGTPVRMRGTCIDVTEQRQHSIDTFRAVVDASLEAIAVLDRSGTIVQANQQAADLLGADPVGHAIDELFPEGMASGTGVPASGLDGRMLTLDLTSALLPRSHDQESGEEQTIAIFFRDASERLSREVLVANLREAQVRRKHALDLNDNVVQGLTAVALAMAIGDHDAAETYLQTTLGAARGMMNNLLVGISGQEITGGDLVRAHPSRLEPVPIAAPQEPSREARRSRILIADDNDDVRSLLVAQIEASGYTVVGEAADGQEAIERAGEVSPDVVVMDLAMPRMDGLQALPLVKAAAPNARVIILSGFDQQTMAEKALEAGADLYVEKGLRMRLDEAIEKVLAS